MATEKVAERKIRHGTAAWIDQADIEELSVFARKHKIEMKKVMGIEEMRTRIKAVLAKRRSAAAKARLTARSSRQEVEPSEQGTEQVAGGTDWEVETAGLIEWADGLEGQVAEQLKDLEGKMNALRDQQDSSIRELRGQLDGRPTKEQYGVFGSEIAEEIKKLRDLISKKASDEGLAALNDALTTRVTNQALRDVLLGAEKQWAQKVREAIETTLEGRDKKKFLEWWDAAMEWLNKPVGGEQ